jgi:hypothetical protein
MLSEIRTVTLCLLGPFLLASCPSVGAEDAPRGAVTQGMLDQALSRKLSHEDAARQTIRTLLERDDVQKLAAGYGLDARRAADAVGTLQGEELDRLASQAAQVQSDLAGGEDVVVLRIGVVALLLIVIIAILAARQ